jgi:hypothetical protein
MLVNRFFMCSSRHLLGCLSVATFISAVSVVSLSRPALASSDGPVLLEMPIYSRTSSDDLISQAESMVSQEINHYFDTNSDLAEIEVVVLGSRNGDIVPILTTTVSRTQWQENSQVNAWTKYYSAHALIRRHDVPQPTRVATSPRRSTAVASQGISAQFDRQFDSGRLDGRTVQAYADLVD